MKILSAIQPSESIHIGNYFGAIHQWKNINNKNCIFFIADLHSLTTYNYKKFNIYEKSLELLATYLACGLSDENIFFLQSQCLNHCYFSWILSTLTGLGEINRMVQMKDKSKDYDNVGVLIYPILMAADILLYNAEYVPVGQDQYQHLELARDLAKRLNNLLQNNYFNLPMPLKNKVIKIYDLQDGSKKMSKSNGKGCLFLTDTNEIIEKKIMKAKSDNEPMPSMDENYSHRIEITNLINLYSYFTNKEVKEIIDEFQQQPIVNFKKSLVIKAIAFIEPIRLKSQDLMDNHKDYLLNILNKGKEWANIASNKNLEIVNEYFLGLKKTII